MSTGNFIAYYRVSTDRQGQSGLGLEAQRSAVSHWLKGGDRGMIAEFVEVESGNKATRPMLQEALHLCQSKRATLIIAKLDRLARNVHFISGLMQSGIEFVAVDNPHANKLMLHMLAAFAEHEREQISKRTIEALQVAKQRGKILGSNAASLAERNIKLADNFARKMRPTIGAIESMGVTTVRGICQELNRLGVTTSTGNGKWHVSAVHRLIMRMQHI